MECNSSSDSPEWLAYSIVYDSPSCDVPDIGWYLMAYNEEESDGQQISYRNPVFICSSTIALLYCDYIGLLTTGINAEVYTSQCRYTNSIMSSINSRGGWSAVQSMGSEARGDTLAVRHACYPHIIVYLITTSSLSSSLTQHKFTLRLTK